MSIFLKEQTKKIVQPDFVAYTDGGYVIPENIGASACVILNGGSVYYRWSKACRNQTNNRQELGAMIHAVLSVPEGSSLLIVSDSQYCIGVLNGSNTPHKNCDLIDYFRTFCHERNVSVLFQWVRGHGDDPWNNYADALSSEAIDRFRLGGDKEWESFEDCYVPYMDAWHNRKA